MVNAIVPTELSFVPTGRFRQLSGDFEQPWYGGAIWYDAEQEEFLSWEGIGDGGCDMFPVQLGTHRLRVELMTELTWYDWRHQRLLTIAQWSQQLGQAVPTDKATLYETLGGRD